MKYIITPLVMSTALMTMACSNYAYAEGQHMAESGHHSQMESHHDLDAQPSHHTGSKKHHQDIGTKNHHQEMKGHEHAMESTTGGPGTNSDVTRSIIITADDTMRFKHDPLNIKEGETIKFIVTNKGAIVHEFAIATKDEHKKHGAMMINNPTMHHEPGGNVVSIKPGETQTLIWTFKKAWQIEAVCNIPGHYEAGMHSPISIKGK